MENFGPAARPMRRRGIERKKLLLDATERLLDKFTDEDITLAQIAEEAEVPLPSVYHFFPNRNAAFEALAKRFSNEIYALSITPLRDPEPQTWQQLIEMIHIRAAAFQNSRPAALRLFLGAGVSVAVRNADLIGNMRLAGSRERYFAAYFNMPVVHDLRARLEVSMAINDGVWALSYGQYGFINEELRAQATEAVVAYLRLFLPEYIDRKPLTEDSFADVLITADN